MAQGINPTLHTAGLAALEAALNRALALAPGSAAALAELLSDQTLHDTFSATGRARAVQLTWTNAAKPLVAALGLGNKHVNLDRRRESEVTCA